MKKLSVTLNRTENILGWCYLAIELLVLSVIFDFILVLLDLNPSVTEYNFIFFAFNFLATTLIFHRFLIENGKVFIETPWWCLRAAGLGFLANWVLSYALSVGIAIFDPTFFNVNDMNIDMMFAENYALMAIGTVFLAPVAEELLYRGLIFGQLYNKNRFLAYLVSTVAFSFLHIFRYIGIYPPVQLLICFLQYIPAALSLAWAYAKSDTIWVPILIHIANNQIATMAVR